MNTDRKFSISDGLILIAGIAAGMALVRMTNPGITPGQVRDAFLSPQGGWTLLTAFELTLETGVMFVIPFVAAWTPACLLVQMTGPRPRWRRLRRQPGLVACLVASTVTLATIAVSVALLAASDMGYPHLGRRLLREGAHPGRRAGGLGRIVGLGHDVAVRCLPLGPDMDGPPRPLHRSGLAHNGGDQRVLPRPGDELADGSVAVGVRSSPEASEARNSQACFVQMASFRALCRSISARAAQGTGTRRIIRCGSRRMTCGTWRRGTSWSRTQVSIMVRSRVLGSGGEPVFEPKIRDALEVGNVVGHQRQVVGEGGDGD